MRMGYKTNGWAAVLIIAGISILHGADELPLSVYKTSLRVDGPITTLAALGAGVPLFFEDELINKSEYLKREDVNPFDRGAAGNSNKAVGFASHLVVGTALIAPVVIDYYDVGWNKIYLEDMVVYTQALAVQSAVANLARFTTKRPRPDAYDPLHQPVTQAEEFESFYSGHTASIFAALTATSLTYTYRYGPSPWPWIITVAVGFGQGTMRVIAGRHFPSDVLAGAAVGTVIGGAVPMLHHHAKTKTWSLLPNIGEDDAGLVFQKKF